MGLLSYKWSALLLTVSFVLLGFGVAAVFEFVNESGTHLQSPGEVVLSVDKSEEYIIFIETTAIIDGRIMTYPLDVPSGTEIQVARMPEETEVAIRPYHNMSMSSPGVRRASVALIPFPSPGRYRVRVTGTDQHRGFYLAPNTFFAMILRLMSSIGLGMLSLFAAVGLAIRQYIINSKVDKTAETATELE